MIERIRKGKIYFYEGNNVEILFHGHKSKVVKRWFPEIVRYRITHTNEIKTALKACFKKLANDV